MSGMYARTTKSVIQQLGQLKFSLTCFLAPVVTSWSMFKKGWGQNSSSPGLWWCPCGLTEKPTPDPHCSCSSEVLSGNLVSYKETETNKKPFIIIALILGHFREHIIVVVCTCLEAVNGECGLSQEILVTEHVNLINHEAQEGKGRVAHGELEWLSGPCGVQAIVSWRRLKKKLDGQRKMSTTICFPHWLISHPEYSRDIPCFEFMSYTS